MIAALFKGYVGMPCEDILPSSSREERAKGFLEEQGACLTQGNLNHDRRYFTSEIRVEDFRFETWLD